MATRTEVVRARWQLWAITLGIIVALAGTTILLATNSEPLPEIAFLPSRALLAIALGGLVLAFGLYAFDRERNLHRLAERLMAEQIEGDRLATRLQYLAELARERDTNDALLEGSADGIAVVDRDLVLVRFNVALGRLCGVGAAEALGADAESILRFAGVNGEPLLRIEHPLRAVLADGVARPSQELRLLLPDGSERWVSATFSPIYEAEGEVPLLVLVTIRDIAEQKEQEVMQRDFVSMAAHELRSPLTAIKGFTRTLMLKFGQLSEERRYEYLTVVNEQSNRLASLVNDLMEVSRIEAGRVMLEPEEIDLGELALALVEQFREKWGDRPIAVAVEGGPLPLARADRRKAEEILINLIDNAIKYSPADTTVQVSIRNRDAEIEVAVRDEGEGIPSHELDSLFQKFHRLASAKRSDVPGTGLGLYIVKGLVEAHGGHVVVDSVPGAGSTFTFTLPASPVAAALRSVSV